MLRPEPFNSSTDCSVRLQNPLFWNIVARQGALSSLLCFSASREPKRQLTRTSRAPSASSEHKNKILTKLAFGKPYWGCYGLAATIFSLGILRDHLFVLAQHLASRSS